MLSLSLFSLSLAALTLAGPPSVLPPPSLIVQLSGPTNVVSLDDLIVTAKVTNTGTRHVRLLKYATVLDGTLPTRAFNVTKEGREIPFVGAKLQLSLPDVKESAFVTIRAGASVTVNHTVSSLYDFSSVGPGTFNFAPRTAFKTMDNALTDNPDFSLTTLDAATAPAYSVDITADVVTKPLQQINLDTRAVPKCSNHTKRAFIRDSLKEGQFLARRGLAYINANGQNDDVYKNYWGNLSTSLVAEVLGRVANETSQSRTLSCIDTYNVCEDGVVAYTVTASTNIYYCDLFFDQVPSMRLCSGRTTVDKRNIRGGTTLHELTHAVAETDDVTYGCAADQALDDNSKLVNADNYNCFTTQVYQDTVCDNDN